MTYHRLVDLIRPTWKFCACCGNPGDPENFDAHHPYKRGKGKAEWKTYLVMPLCRTCHDSVHANEKKARDCGLLVKVTYR